jgi:Fe-S-cluster-containing dehydrogenase component
MMKCNLCYDRTSAGRRPMCSTVCPSGALTYTTREQMTRMRPGSTPVNVFRFGGQMVKTKVHVMMPKGSTELVVD